MYYIKTKLGENTELHVTLHDDNIFDRCAKCGREVQICLADFFSAEDANLDTASVICGECTKSTGALHRKTAGEFGA